MSLNPFWGLVSASVISDFIALIDFGKVFIFAYCSAHHHKCVKPSRMIHCTSAEEALCGNKTLFYMWNKNQSHCLSFVQQMLKLLQELLWNDVNIKRGWVLSLAFYLPTNDSASCAGPVPS